MESTSIGHRASSIAGKIRNAIPNIRQTRYAIRVASRPASSGFTLVEMIVAVALFAIVMLVCVGSLLSLVAANRKVHALQSVMNNLNVTLDGMTRAIRMGATFDGSGGCTSGLNGKDCTGGGTVFSFQPYGTNPSMLNTAWIYKFDTTGSTCGDHALCRSINGGGTYSRITSTDVTIESVLFYVVGSKTGCDTASPCTPIQPKVVIVIKGTAPVMNSSSKSTFHIQVTAVQRLLDL